MDDDDGLMLNLGMFEAPAPAAQLDKRHKPRNWTEKKAVKVRGDA